MTDIKNDRRIVVGVDGSEPSKRALRWAVRQAELTGASLDVINAYDMPMYIGLAPVLDVSAEREEIAKAGEQIVAETVAEVIGENSSVPIRTRVAAGHPAYALLEAAKGADLLVVGCRGHGGFVGALLGSVSQHCVQHATCPVVVVRAPHGKEQNG